MMDTNIVFKIRQYLESQNIVSIDSSRTKQQQWLNGRLFSFEEHIKGMIYAQLSQQRRWADIEHHFPEIDAVFFQYNPLKLKETDSQYFENSLKDIRCGNRAVHFQMQSLRKNIETMEMIIREYGSMDNFVSSDVPGEIVKKISSSKSPYKLKWIGESLAYEYLRNVGIDCAKPDVHLRRLFGSERLGYSLRKIAAKTEVNAAVNELSLSAGVFRADIDYLLWCFCAEGFGGICGAKPRCDCCVVSQYCRYQNRLSFLP